MKQRLFRLCEWLGQRVERRPAIDMAWVWKILDLAAREQTRQTDGGPLLELRCGQAVHDAVIAACVRERRTVSTAILDNGEHAVLLNDTGFVYAPAYDDNALVAQYPKGSYAMHVPTTLAWCGWRR